MQVKPICIIPARGGSKRIPKKNVKQFCGRPLISYPIESALKSGVFSSVIVSTDCEEICEVALSCGAAVPFLRSKKSSNDYAPVNEAIKETISSLIKIGVEVHDVCCLYATAPFVEVNDLVDSKVIFDAKGCWVLSVVESNYPVLRGLVQEGESIRYKWPIYADSRSQDLEKFYFDVGQFYWAKADQINALNGLADMKYFPYVMSSMKCQDIDTMDDWYLAEFKYRFIQEKLTSNNEAL